VARAKLRKTRSRRNSKAVSRAREIAPDISWIRTLATPYLHEFRASSIESRALRGYRFVPPGSKHTKPNVSFFVGYLLEPKACEFLGPAPPEAAVFVYLGPVGSALHEEIVAREGSLLRKTAEYIGWLTHRPPRFAFFDDREIVLSRHVSMKAWPTGKYAHFSRNFFIETLAWLVRSGLVAKLRAGGAAPAKPEIYEKRND
jgi:hypothetical protein